MTVHAKHPFPDTPEEIDEVASQVRDPNFRVQISPRGLHVYNRDGLRLGQGAFELWPQLGLGTADATPHTVPAQVGVAKVARLEVGADEAHVAQARPAEVSHDEGPRKVGAVQARRPQIEVGGRVELGPRELALARQARGLALG